MKRNGLVLTTVLALMLIVEVAFAAPGLPNEIYGAATIDGATIPAGTVIEAKILDGTTWTIFGTAASCSTNDYCMLITADDSSTPTVKEGGIIGDEIRIYIDGNLANTSISPLTFIDQMSSPGGRVVNISYTSTTTEVCGNNLKEGTEQCDGTDLASQTCTTKGFDAGTLGCSATCSFDTSACTEDTTPNSPGGGGGSGRGSSEAEPVEEVNLPVKEETITSPDTTTEEDTANGEGITGGATSVFTIKNIGIGAGVVATIGAVAGLALYLRR